MDTMKRIGAGILGALEGVLVVFVITAIMLVVNDRKKLWYEKNMMPYVDLDG